MIGSSQQPVGNALKGAFDVGSRVRIAAAACLMASGLLAGGACASMAFAGPPLTGDSGDKHTNDSLGDSTRDGVDHGRDGSGEGPKSDPGEKKTAPGEHSGTVGNDGDKGKGNGGTQDLSPTTKPPPTTKPAPSEEPPPPTGGPGQCKEEKKAHCSPGWPWWPWPWNPGPGAPPGPGGNGGGGGAPAVPSGRPSLPPQMQLPPELMPPATEPVGPSVIDVAPGVGVAAAELPIAPITLPVVVAPVTGLGGGSSGTPTLPGAPRGVTAEPLAGREPLPANVGSNVAVPASSYRIGYTEYLRSAGLSQVAALAGPGVAGMLVLTGAGGLVGYRQAKAGHAVHTSGTARFVN